MYRVTTLFTGPLVNGGGINQLYFDQGGGTAAQAHAAVRAFWQNIDDVMHNSVAYQVLPEVELVDNITGQVEGIETTDNYAGTGQLATDPLPPTVQGLVRWRTGVYNNGREVRGRTFLPGMCEGNSDAGAPTSGTVGVFNTAAGNLVGDPNSTLVVWSRKGLFADVVSGQAWTKWGSLRSRRD